MTGEAPAPGPITLDFALRQGGFALGALLASNRLTAA